MAAYWKLVNKIRFNPMVEEWKSVQRQKLIPGTLYRVGMKLNWWFITTRP